MDTTHHLMEKSTKLCIEEIFLNPSLNGILIQTI